MSAEIQLKKIRLAEIWAAFFPSQPNFSKKIRLMGLLRGASKQKHRNVCTVYVILLGPQNNAVTASIISKAQYAFVT